jgi:hypothetical protein
VIAYLKNRLALGGAVLIVASAILAGACGDDDDGAGTPAEPTATVADAGASVPSSGSVAPNTFLTFEGQQFRLVELLQADLIDEGAFEEAGEASEADIDQEDLTVYRKADDPDAVYTYAPGIEGEAVGEGVPALWYRWSLEP